MSRSACAIGKDYVPASFKGVLFYCTSADIEGGRRGAEGEFPFGEDTAYADLGRKIRVFKLSAAFREDDHVWDSQALFEACQSPGPGLLVHPTRGTHMVACRSITVSDKLEEAAGETTAELEFVEANEVGGILGSIFGILSTGLFLASQASFMRDYTPNTVPHPWRVDVIEKAQGLIWAVHQTAARTVVADAPTSTWRQVTKIGEVAKDNGLAAIASNVDKALVAGFNITANNVVDPFAEFNMMRRLANKAVKSSNLPVGAPTDSEEAVLSRFRILAGIKMAESAMARKYTTVDEALSAMDATIAVLNDEAHYAYSECDNKLFMELKKYTTEFSRMMNELAYHLPGLVIVDFMGGIHSLVASYAIYKDAKRHRELEARNKIDANGRFGAIVVGLTPTAS